jgi:outer membrane protein assembly factor BamB
MALGMSVAVAQELDNGDPKLATYKLPKLSVGQHDWPQWGGTSARNSTPAGRRIPTEWDVQTGKNIKWSAPLGSQTYGSPVIASGRVFVSTNNGYGHLKRFPNDVDLGCLLCFEESAGRFLWQYSSPKLPTAREHDHWQQGIVSTPLVDGERLWVVTNRCEVVCLDALGFRDGENDGPFRDEEVRADDEADVLWKFDIMGQLGVWPHNMSACSLTCAGDTLFVVTGNGVDESHANLPKPDAPAFVALHRRTGKVVWTSGSHGQRVLHGSWSSPAYAQLGGRPQVLFPGGDGWLYSFDPAGDGKGGPKLLWKFDGNPKSSRHVFGGKGDRNEFITMPVIYNGRVYFALGQDPEHGEGPSSVWCLDPAKRLDGSDVSAELVADTPDGALPAERTKTGVAKDRVRPNPNSAALWRYSGTDIDRDGKIAFEEEMHRACAHLAVSNGLAFVSDFSGLLHCIDADTGRAYWTHDLNSATWASAPLIVDGKVFVADEDGDVTIFRLSQKRTVLAEINVGMSIYSALAVANDVLYVASKTQLFAIATPR